MMASLRCRSQLRAGRLGRLPGIRPGAWRRRARSTTATLRARGRAEPLRYDLHQFPISAGIEFKPHVEDFRKRTAKRVNLFQLCVRILEHAESKKALGGAQVFRVRAF